MQKSLPAIIILRDAEVYKFVARGSKQPANSGGPYFLGIYLLVSAMTSSRDKLGRG